MAEFLTTVWHFILGVGLFFIVVFVLRVLGQPSVVKFLLIIMGISLFLGDDDDDMDC